jgi:Barstar (barnase inhibitor)
MDYDKLVRPGPPEFYVTTISVRDFDNLHLRLAGTYEKAVVRMIRGKKSQTIDDLFNEVGAALQFPYYFGENWPSFNECIYDLDWLPGEAYILMFSEANLLLQHESKADLRVLIRILTEAHENWIASNQSIPDAGPAPAYSIVFQVAAEDLASFSERVKEAGATLQTL